MTSAAIYARVSSARQKKDETIGSQTAALRAHAADNRLEVPEEWVFEDDGHCGATLVRPALEQLRDLAAQGCLDVILCYSPARANSSSSSAWQANLRASRSGEYTSTTSRQPWAARSRSASSPGRTSVAPECPSSSNTHSGGTSSALLAACLRSAAVCDPIVSSFFCRAEETRA